MVGKRANLEKLQKFIIIGKQVIQAHKAQLKAMKDFGMAKQYHDAKLSDVQETGVIVLQAKCRMGDMLEAIPLKK